MCVCVCDGKIVWEYRLISLRLLWLRPKIETLRVKPILRRVSTNDRSEKLQKKKTEQQIDMISVYTHPEGSGNVCRVDGCE